MDLPVTYAGGLYDRTLPLQSGEIQPEGIRLRYLSFRTEDIFWRMMRYQEYDASEMSLASYSIARERGEPDFVAIPVFPSRHFRLSCFYVREGSSLRSLEELSGKRVGVPEYQMTMAVWLRGILAEHYGVPSESISWFTGRPERLTITYPASISIRPYQGPGGLDQALLSGEIDAMMAGRTPEPFASGKGMRRLLENSREVEAEYFKKTRLFPIMHTVVLKGELYRQHPWAASSMYEAFCEAKRRALDAMYDTTAVRFSLPWLVEEMEKTREVLGDDFWPYGFAANVENVDTVLRYLFEQGLTEKRMGPEALFPNNLLET